MYSYYKLVSNFTDIVVQRYHLESICVSKMILDTRSYALSFIIHIDLKHKELDTKLKKACIRENWSVM